MQQNLQRVRTAKLPRRTFSFSSRKLAGKATTHSVGVDQSEYQDTERLTDGLTGVTVNVPYNGGDYLLQNLTKCEIVVGSLDALYVDHLQGCTLIATNITGGFHVENCYGCTFKVKCHQLRIHQTVNSEFKIHAGSAPIIENCHDVRFSRLNADDQSGLWKTIRDFSWLKNSPSPNYTVVDEQDN